MQIYLQAKSTQIDMTVELCQGLDVTFTSPVLDHAASDDCGVAILRAGDNKFWHDNKGASKRHPHAQGVTDADIVVNRFGEKYKQWNAAFDAGYAAALGKSLIMHGDDHQHALKEVDAAALAVTSAAQVAQILICAARRTRLTPAMSFSGFPTSMRLARSI